MEKERVLLAGATGYLGSYITQELLSRDIPTRLVVRDKNKVKIADERIEIVEAEIVNPNSLENLFDDIDVVISTVGITRQKDGLTYMDVDYQANANLIDGALKSKVRKFIYISVLNGDKLRDLAICAAKEQLGDYLIQSDLDYCIVRPNGFFSDMGDFLKMAKGGRVYLFGDGTPKLNPIHGSDLAKVVVDSIETNVKEIDVGGPDLLSQNEIAELALEAYSKPRRIVHLPDWIRRLSLWILRIFTSSKTYGPIEFFMTTMVMEMQAPQYGNKRLKDFFRENAN